MSGDDVPVRTDVSGPFGRVTFIPYVADQPHMAAHLCAYLIDAPTWHPLWSQYQLAVVTLQEAPGLPDPKLHFPGATHELLVIALNPDHPQTLETMIEHGRRGTLPYLTPVNIAHQFTATDEEMERVAWLAARGVVEGLLNPETGDAPTKIREQWLSSCVRTLAHIRGEEHTP